MLGENIIFTRRKACEVRLNPHEVRLKQTLENSETQKNSVTFWGKGNFDDDI